MSVLSLEDCRRAFSLAPHVAELGIVPVEVGEGRVTSELRIERRHLQHSGVVHAGVMATMADHTMGFAAQSVAPEGQLVLTAEFKCSLLRGARGERLECEARVLKPGRSLTFTEAEVYAVESGHRSLVIKASATMALAPMPPGVSLRAVP
ncbi:MAG: PaaI family thioesterase [Rubrivivax sp.]|nr:PaaI family thioesterase [Rubrivivax sp.]